MANKKITEFSQVAFRDDLLLAGVDTTRGSGDQNIKVLGSSIAANVTVNGLPTGGTTGQVIQNQGVSGQGTWHTLVAADVSNLTALTLASNEFLVGVTSSPPVNKTPAQVRTILHVDKAALSMHVFDAAVQDKTYTIIVKSPSGFTIDSIDISVSTGTLTAALQIGGVSVTSLSAISVTSTPQHVVATGANTIVAGNTVTLVVSANASADNLLVSVNMTRT